jgi:hypothetical protein
MPLPGRFERAWRGLPAGASRLTLLCIFVIVIEMIRPRLSHSGAGWLLLACGLATVGAALAFSQATHRVLARSRLMSASLRRVDAVRLVIRRTGLPLLGLAFFLFWTFVYVGLWWYRSEGTFTFSSLQPGESPRFADFFYYSVSAALIATPQDIVAVSRGARAATMIEMILGLALLTTYITTLIELRRNASREAGAAGPGEPSA